jgi:hypothetical protein
MKEKLNLQNETHKHVWSKFLILFAILLGYFVFVSLKYGAGEGFLIAWLTWAFFVLCTPIADAGFIIDFPIRMLFGVKMIISEVVVWGIAILIAYLTFDYSADTFTTTKVLQLFYHILQEPIPYWSIILISGIGTFISIKFGDELIDVLKHKDREYYKAHLLKWRVVAVVALFIMVIIIYELLLQKLGTTV